MGASSSKVPQYEIVEQQPLASTSETPRLSEGGFSPPSQGLLQPSSSSLQQWAPVQLTPPPPLPRGWDFHIDPATGYPYFYNTLTGVSQWQDPRGPGFALPDRSDDAHLGQRRQVVPPWEGGPADSDPLSWPLPPGWLEQQDQATKQRYFVNYDAHILSYKDPRLEIAKAYAQRPTVPGAPVYYPPPVIGFPVDNQQKPFEYSQSGPTPPFWSSTPGGTSSLPPPPPLKKKRKLSLWSKLGYRHGKAGGRTYTGGGAVYLFDNPEVPGRDESDGSSSSSSDSSSSDDQDDENDGGHGDWAGSDIGSFSLGQNVGLVDNENGIGGDIDALDDYGRPEAVSAGVNSVNLGNIGGGGNVPGGYQQPLFGSWGSQTKDLQFQSWNNGLKQPLKGGKLLVLDGYTKTVFVLTVFVGLYFGIVEGLLASLLAFSCKLVVSAYKRAKLVKGKQKSFFGKVLDIIRWIVKKKGSTLVQFKTAVILQFTQIQALFYEHMYEHPVVKVRMLTEKDGAGPLHSRLPSLPREITVVTQASADRLPAIEAMATSWGGVMCVAIHVRTRDDLQQVYPRLCSLHKRIEARGLCRLHICVAEEEGLSTEEEARTALYPINAMRNLALSMATTELVFILDADFVPSLGMHELLTGDDTAYSEIVRMATTDHQMLVVPAFEGVDGKFELSSMSQIMYPTRMGELRKHWREGSAKAFHCSHFPRGHEPTNYELFFNRLTVKPYRAQYSEFYEPYVICSRELIPPFDARFRGYGLNKISHAYNCAVKGMGFSVLPEVFVWSLPHCKSEAWKFTFGKHKDPLQKLKILGLYRRFKAEMRLLHRSGRKIIDQGTCASLLEIKVEEANSNLVSSKHDQ